MGKAWETSGVTHRYRASAFHYIDSEKLILNPFHLPQ
jgi:hypothetical protein